MSYRKTVWQDSYAVGVKEIDDQHKMLLAILNDLNRAIADARGERRLHQLLWNNFERLNEYAAFHFMSEEKLMQAHLSADAAMARHIAQHRQYWVAIDGFKQRTRQNEAGILPQLAEFLNNWWLDHIQVTDAQLGRELNARGVA